MAPKLQSTFPALCLLGVLTLLLCPSGLCDCRTFPSIVHGSCKDVSSFWSFTTVVQYKCDEGYVLIGQPEITCRHSHWSAPAPVCKALCQRPKIKNGGLTVHKNQYAEAESVTVQCDDGYVVIGSRNLTCSENRTWLPAVPRCQWEDPKCCEQVFAGKKIQQCLPNPEDVKMALEIYKLSMEIQHLHNSST